MNTLFRSTLLAAMVVLPAVAFAEPPDQVTGMQVETIAYEGIGSDSAPAQAHIYSAHDHVGTIARTPSDTAWNPASSVGLKSIYVGH